MKRKRSLIPWIAGAAAFVAAPSILAQRTIDGSNNNPFDPTMGAANTSLPRVASSEYGDGLSTPAGGSRPSARVISNTVCAQPGPVFNEGNASDYLWQWGQFLDHDIDLSSGASPAESFDIPVPTGDPFFDPFSTGTQVIGLDRTLYTVDGAGVRQQINEITSWIDASNVYGSNAARAAELRRNDGSGKLETTAHPSGDLLPFNVNGFPNAPTGADPTLFLAGDVRANEQVGLTCMHTLFVREHNRLCDVLRLVFPFLSGDDIYQQARAIVGAEMQIITYEEFLPLLLGPGAIPPYRGYDPSVNGAVGNEFSTASYRFGHSLLSSTLLRLDRNLNEIPAGHLPLLGGFFNPGEILNNGGIEPLLRGLARQRAQRVDTMVVDDVRNFLFGPPGAGGFDLASLNIQRGRDHGLADYNAVRVALGLPARTGFDEITSDAALADALESLYGSVDDIDLWVGGLAEDHVPGALVGETLRAVLADQFTRLRDGDRFWHERSLNVIGRILARGTTLSRVIRRNTSIRASEVQPNAFVVPGPVVTGDSTLTDAKVRADAFVPGS